MFLYFEEARLGWRKKREGIEVNRCGKMLAEERFEFSDILESKNH